MSLSATLLSIVKPFTSNAQQVGEVADTLVAADQLTTRTYVNLRSRVVQQLIRNHGYELLNHHIGEGTVSAKLQAPHGTRFWLVFSNTDEFTIGVDYAC
ncbi:hypothetical protein [Vibrio phage vB_VpS_CA8]|nr:hypothetical protein [Vibrio phage vB_VpS_CA8]QEQ95155.1 hypothetical protein [Vibrio phage vB_VpS_BA3]